MEGVFFSKWNLFLLVILYKNVNQILLVEIFMIFIPVNSPDFVRTLPIFNPLSRLSPDRLKIRDFSRFFRNLELTPISPDY